MIGNDLLVAPVLRPDVVERLVYLPKGRWYDYWTNKKYEGGTMIRAAASLETVPMFVRGGAIIPMAPEMNYVGEKPTDALTFGIYPDDNGSASTTLYEDDGISPAYEQEVFRRTTINAVSVARGYVVTAGVPLGRYKPGTRKFSFAVKSARETHSVVTILDDGKARKIEIK
jgi:alpha-glucosidase